MTVPLYGSRKHILSGAPFVMLALIVLLPAFGPGQLFLLDMPWPEQLSMAAYTQNGLSTNLPIMTVLWLLNFIVPAWLLQKLVLLALLALSGFGMFLLQKNLGRLRPFFAIAAGALYMLNPYVLDRLLAGQWLVLAGYAFLPFFAQIVYAAFTKPSSRTLMWAIGAWLLYATISIHWWYIITLFLLPVLLYKLGMYYRHSRRALSSNQMSRTIRAVRSFAKNRYICIPALIGMLCISAWLVVLIGRYYAATSAITGLDFTAFATQHIDILGPWGAVLSLQGFWHSNGVIPDALGLVWLATCGVLLALTCSALVMWHKRHPLRAGYAGWVMVTAIVLAVGYASPVGLWITDILRNVLPGYSGLREPQKMVGLIAFMYATAAPFALQRIIERRATHRIAQYSSAVVGAYVLCMSFAVYTAHASLRPYHYPADWQVAYRILQHAKPQRVLVLPWNGYIHVPFANDTFMANPATRYFGVRADVRQDSGNSALDSARGTTAVDRTILLLKTEATPLPAIRALGYDYVLLTHMADYLSYKKQLDASGAQTVYTGKSLSLYKIP